MLYINIFMIVVDVLIIVFICPDCYKFLESNQLEQIKVKHMQLEQITRTKEFLDRHIYKKPENIFLNDCAICLDDFKTIDIYNENIVNLECTHKFHYKCILDWFDIRKKYICPMCKKDYSVVPNVNFRFRFRRFSNEQVEQDTQELSNEELFLNRIYESDINDMNNMIRFDQLNFNHFIPSQVSENDSFNVVFNYNNQTHNDSVDTILINQTVNISSSIENRDNNRQNINNYDENSDDLVQYNVNEEINSHLQIHDIILE